MSSLPLKLNGTATGVTSRSLNLVEGTGISLTPTGSDTLQIDFDGQFNGSYGFLQDTWHTSQPEGSNRLYFQSGATTFIKGYGTTGSNIVFRDQEDNSVFFFGGNNTGPRIVFGPDGDTNLYRDSANILKTDDGLKVAGVYYGGAYAGVARSPGDIVARRSANTGAVYFGDNDTYLYFNGTNISTTFPTLHSSGGQQVYVGAVGPGSKAGLTFSNNEDVNLYRDATNTLKTDDSLIVSGSLFVDQIQSDVGGDPYVLVSSGGDGKQFVVRGHSSQTANLQEWQDNNGTMLSRITSLGYFATLGNMYLQADGTSIFFGASSDVNLYRYGANGLATDDYFYAKGSFIQTDGYFTTGTGGVILSEANAGGYIEIDEATGDAGGATDKVRLFCKDVAGKTKLYAVFQTGAIVLVATEP